MKKVAIVLIITSSFVFAQNTYVPDDKFEQALIDLGYDTTLDDSVVTANISGVTTLDIRNKDISDLTGIEAFAALTDLVVSNNKLTSLDVSQNTALWYLNCSYNLLTSLDVSKNTALKTLQCYNNKLTALDVSQNTALTFLACFSNQLTSLDVSKNTALTWLSCGVNQLTSLDVSKNTALDYLSFGNNQLTSLDVSKNTALETLECSLNKLTSLDVSKNTALVSLNCLYNQLTSLNMRNGVNLELYTFNATNNPNLTCIETLDPAHATTNLAYIDAGVTFSVICGGTDLTTWHVDTTGSDGSGSGTETSPLATIQTGINAATDGDTVLVAAGTYNENINFNGKNISVVGDNRETTIIDGNQSGSVVTFKNGEDSTAVLSRFKIVNGDGSINSSDYITGGGILCDNNSSPTLENLIVANNSARDGGGGIACVKSSNPKIKNSIISNNSTEKNSYSYGGGGIFIYTESSPTINNVVIAFNSSGVAIYPEKSNVTLTNVTLAYNSIPAIRSWTGNTITLTNCILWDELSSNPIVHPDVNTSDDIPVKISYSLIRDGYNGTNNISKDPKFMKIITTGDEESDYHLADWSPAIGAGTATGAPTTDIEGNPRPNPSGSNPDMGAFENKWGTPQNAPPVIATQSDLTIAEDGTSTATLTATDANDDAITYSAVSDTNTVTVSVSSTTLTLTPNANWHGVATITAYASDGTAKDSTSFKLTVTPVQDAPTAFDWVSSALDTINITQSNLADSYTLQWDASTDVDGDSINYLIYAKIGLYPTEEVEEITDTTFQLIYEEILENVFEGSPVNGATVSLNVKATDGIDTVNVTGDNRVIYVNRYEYLSTEGEAVPVEFALHENYPNPFNPTTTLRFDLPEVSDITLTIYNMLGQKVKTFNMQSTPAGYHSITWDATNDLNQQVGAGVYLYQLQTKDFVKTRKMVLLK